MRATPVAFLALSLFACTGEAPAVPEVEFRGPAHVRPYLQTYLDAPGGPPSISLAIAVDGEMVVAEAVGFADLESQRAATPNTAYRTYSISKGITAIGVLQQVESGTLDLDDDIRSHVSAFPEKPWPIRLRHLLTHTSGVRHYKANAGEISSTTEYSSLADSLRVFADDPLEFEPGRGYRYTSFGFNLLTGAIENSTGRRFERVLETSIFEPAAMNRSSLAIASGRDEDLAKAYWAPRLGKHREVDDLPNVSGKYGSSGVVSTPTDLVKLFLALDRLELLRADTLDLMLTTPYPELAPEQGYGWNVVTENGRRVVYRTGAGTGYTGIVEYFPDHEVIGAVLINQNQYPGRVPILERALEYFLDP
ncbi:MAG: serine hydrolase domain-containing protein [Acidobacteriota bacterium]